MTSTQTLMRGDFIEDCLRAMRCASADELARVDEAGQLIEHAEYLLDQAVAEASAARRTWAQIAAALGISATHASQRWASAG